MLWLKISLLTLFLAGCGLTSEGQLVKEAIKVKGAIVADAGLDNGLWFVCNATTIGSVRRLFGTSADRALAYRDFCKLEGTNDVIRN